MSEIDCYTKLYGSPFHVGGGSYRYNVPHYRGRNPEILKVIMACAGAWNPYDPLP